MNLTENIEIQRLILKCEEDTACVFFIDENQENHKYDFSDGAFVNLYQLVISCFEPIYEDNDCLLTCGCGISGCAGFYEFNSNIKNEEIIWKVNNSDVFKFNKKQYLEEVKSCLSNLLIKSAKKEFLGYLGAESLSKKNIEKLIFPFSNYDELAKRKFPRNKITIFPDSKHIYYDENNKKYGLIKNELWFFGTDFFGDPYKCCMRLEEINNWTEKLKENQICWTEWNNEGIKYAQQIRNALPIFFDVWYRFQGEKKEDLQIFKKNEN